MADVTGTSSTTTTAVRYAPNSGGKISEDKTSLKNQDFLQLLIKQMQHQDPSSPMDSNAIMQQTATMSSTQAMQQMIEVQQEQFALQMRTTASGFVGQTVTYTDGNGTQQSGLVTAASFAKGTPVLAIGGASVNLDAVSGISKAAATASSTASSTATTGSSTAAASSGASSDAKASS